LKNISLVIRTFNSERYIPGIFAYLGHLKTPPNLECEIVFIDNNSQDKTVAEIKKYVDSSKLPTPIDVVLESQQGALFTRLRGFSRDAHLIAFADADIVLDEDWLIEAIAFGENYKNAGAWVSRTTAIYEGAPPQGIEGVGKFIGLLDLGEETYQYETNVLPGGCACVYRKAAVSKLDSSKFMVLGPQGRSIKSKGEDIEQFIHIKKRGWEIWYNPKMRASHYLSLDRLQKDYLLSLTHSIGNSRFFLRQARYGKILFYFLFPALVLSDFKKWVSCIVKFKKKDKSDIGKECDKKYLEATFWGNFANLFKKTQTPPCRPKSEKKQSNSPS